MDVIYAECRALRKNFIEEEKASMPDYFFTREDGEKFLKREAYDALEKKADDYYRKCLDEKSVHVPHK